MTPDVCPRCHRPVVIARVPWPASSLAAMSLAFSEGVHEVYLVEMDPKLAGRGPASAGPLVGLREGAFVAGELCSHVDFRAAVEKVTMRVPHDLSCPAALAQRSAPPGDQGTCKGCGRTVYWIQTPAGKRAPLDPEPHTGVRLGKIETRAARGTKGYVTGLDRHGLQVSIRRGDQLLLGGGASELVTVWVNHFATCPRRMDFVRPR